MPTTKYTYAIATSFPNGKVDTSRLSKEITDSDITIALDFISTDTTNCDVWFKTELPANDLSLLTGIIAAHTGEALPTEVQSVSLSNVAEDSEGRLRTSSEPRKEGSQIVFVSHNWCDPCTWYTKSARYTGETLTDSGDGLTFGTEYANLIDLSHGRLYREDLVAADHNVAIYIDGVEATQRTPWSSTGGDYEVNYENGTVTFFASQSGKTITGDFSVSGDSTYIVAPVAGKKLWVEKSEVQFSSDVDIANSINFAPFAYDPTGTVAPPDKILAEALTTYKVARDFVDEANGTYPQIPAFGGTTRGLSTSHLVFPFNYLAVKELRSDYGVEIRIWLENHTPFGGGFATAAFYCTSYDL